MQTTSDSSEQMSESCSIASSSEGRREEHDQQVQATSRGRDGKESVSSGEGLDVLKGSATMNKNEEAPGKAELLNRKAKQVAAQGYPRRPAVKLP